MHMYMHVVYIRLIRNLVCVRHHEVLWYVCVGGKLIFQLLVPSPSHAALTQICVFYHKIVWYSGCTYQ